MKKDNNVEVYDLRMTEGYVEVPEEDNNIVTSMMGVVSKVGHLPGKVAGGIINKFNTDMSANQNKYWN